MQFYYYAYLVFSSPRLFHPVRLILTQVSTDQSLALFSSIYSAQYYLLPYNFILFLQLLFICLLHMLFMSFLQFCTLYCFVFVLTVLDFSLSSVTCNIPSVIVSFLLQLFSYLIFHAYFFACFSCLFLFHLWLQFLLFSIQSILPVVSFCYNPVSIICSEFSLESISYIVFKSNLFQFLDFFQVLIYTSLTLSCDQYMYLCVYVHLNCFQIMI